MKLGQLRQIKKLLGSLVARHICPLLHTTTMEELQSKCLATCDNRNSNNV